jgi:hypothetical protein
MRIRSAVHAGCTCAVIGLAACMGDQPTTPTTVNGPELAAAKAATSDEVVRVVPALDRINARLSARGAKFRFATAEVIYAAKAYEAQSATVIIANDRFHQLASQWVEGDPRRDGRVGITYAVDPVLQTFLTGLNFPVPVIETGGNPPFRLSSQAELDGYLEEGMQAWRDRKCSDAPIERVAVAPGTDPDFLDDLFLTGSAPSANYVQPADLLQAGWQPAEFFEAITPGGSDAILGVTFTFIFTDAADNPTDIDGNGRGDVALKEIYYNPTFIWTNRGAPGGFIDFFSVIAHETGHGLGLAHFGKVFITKKDAADGLQIEDVKYAPLALMNAVYVTGRGDIRGTDNGSFCQLWANNK